MGPAETGKTLHYLKIYTGILSLFKSNHFFFFKSIVLQSVIRRGYGCFRPSVEGPSTKESGLYFISNGEIYAEKQNKCIFILGN